MQMRRSFVPRVFVASTLAGKTPFFAARKVASLSCLLLLFGALGAKAQNINTVAGNGTGAPGGGAFGGDGGPAVNASLFQPFGVFLDAAGNIFIVDSMNNRIREVFGPNPPAGQTTGTIVTVAGSSSTVGFGGDNGPATNALLNFPRGIFVDALGNVFIADTNNFRIREVFGPTPPAGQTAGNIITIAGNGTQGFSGDGGPAINAQLSDARGVFVDSSGNIFISDSDNHRIREVFGQNPPPGQLTGNIITVAGNGTPSFSGDGGPATAAAINQPRGNVFVDSNENIFIPDTQNQCIREVFGSNPPAGHTTGTIVTIAGSCGAPGANSGDGGPAIAAKLHLPFEVAGDSFGNIFFPDNANHSVREIFGPNPPTGQTAGNIITVAGNGTSGFSGDGGPAVNAMMDAPSGVFVDPTGNIFIADTKNNRIREVQFPAATLSPNGLTFAATSVGTSSAPQGLTLKNPSTQTLVISSISITGTNSGDFTETDNCGASVAVGANCTINVRFKPTASGSRMASITVTDNAANSPQSVSLTGTGAATAPQASLSPASLTFSSQGVGTSSAAQAVTLTNGGNAALSVTSISITGTNNGDFTQTNTCGTSITAGANCAISVTFKPTTAGARSAAVTITDNAGNSPQSVSLTGTATDFSIGAAQGSSTSATVTAGKAASYSLQLTGAGMAQNISLTCTGAPQGAVCTVPSTVSVTPGTPAAVNVSVSTTARSLLIPMPRGFRPSQRGNPVLILEVLLLAFLFWTLVDKQTQTRGARIISFGGQALAAPLLLLVLIIATMSGCAGKPSTPPANGTPAGTSTLTVTATSNGVSHTTPLTLIVQ